MLTDFFNSFRKSSSFDRQCFDLMFPDGYEVSDEEIKEYASKMETLNVTMGCINFTIALAISIFMINTLI